MKKYFRIIFICLITSLFSCVTTDDPLSSLGSSTFVAKDISYGDHREQTMDIYLPRNSKGQNPVIVLVHGGAWHWGDKGDYEYSIDYYKSRGLTVVNMNYRMGSMNFTLEDKLEDIHSVIEFIYNNRDLLNVTEDLTLLGGSAGGHMVLQYGFTLGVERVDRIISYSGPTDLTNTFYRDNSLLDSIKPLFNSSNPGEEELRRGSPLYSIPSQPGPSVMFIHGNADLVVDFNDSLTLHNKLIEAGWDSSIIEIPGANHAYEGTDWNWVNSIFDSWLDEQLGKKN